jgi:predicted Fe-Mo cluster-binding NifX family protein
MKRLMRALVFPLLFFGSAAVADAATLIAVASDSNQATSLVSEDAGRCRYYLIFAGTGELLDVLDKPYSGSPYRQGPALVDLLVEKGITVIVAEGFGPPMIEAMKARGISYEQFRGIAREGCAGWWFRTK